MQPPPGHRRVHKQVRVIFRGGWWDAIKGETQGRAIERVLKDLDEGGWRISFIVNDRYSFLKRLYVYLVAVLTGFAIYLPPNLIIIAERFEPVDQFPES